MGTRDKVIRFTGGGHEYAFVVGGIEREGDGYRVTVRREDDTQAHSLLVAEMGRVLRVSGGSGPEIRVRLEQDQKRRWLRAVRGGEDDVSGHVAEEQVFDAEVEGDDDVEGHGMASSASSVGLAAGTAFLVLNHLGPNDHATIKLERDPGERRR